MLKRDIELRSKQNNQKEEKSGKASLLMRLAKSRNSRYLKAFSAALAAVIVFGTTYSLILPAITVDQDSAEEMPGIYLEDEGFYEEDYDNTYEDVYDVEDMSENDEDADWSEEDQSMQGGQTDENAPADDEGPETDNNTDNAADDDTLTTSTDSDDVVKTDDNGEAGDEPSYTYNKIIPVWRRLSPS